MKIVEVEEMVPRKMILPGPRHPIEAVHIEANLKIPLMRTHTIRLPAQFDLSTFGGDPSNRVHSI